MLAFAVPYGILALLRHWTFHSTAMDLGVFNQVVWNTVSGRFVESTLSLARCEPHTFFLDHFSPVLLLIVPLYALASRPETLLVVQTVALALGAWPIYLLARRLLPTSEERLVWVAAYVLNAPLAFIILFDFHEIALAAPILGFAMYFLATRQTVLLLLCLASSFLVKEELPLVAVGFGAALILQRRWLLGAAVALVSALVFVLTLKAIIPAFAAGAPYAYLGRYASLGRDELEIARTLVLDPWRVIRVFLSGVVGSKLAFIATLFGPGLGLAVRAPWALAPAIVPLGYLLLSDYGGQHTHHNQYGAPLVPIALAASIAGMATFGDRVKLRRRLAAGVLGASVALALPFSALPLTEGFAAAFLRGDPNRAPVPGFILAREQRYDDFLPALGTIPPDAAVASRDYLVTQVGNRRHLYYLLGLEPCGADYVILDYADPQVNRDRVRHATEVEAMKRKGYEEIASAEGLSLLRRR